MYPRMIAGVRRATGAACQRWKQHVPQTRQVTTATAMTSSRETSRGVGTSVCTSTTCAIDIAGRRSFCTGAAGGTGKGEDAGTEKPAADTAESDKEWLHECEGLQYRDIVEGTGREPFMGEWCSVHYILKLEDGKEIDNSYKRYTPFRFQIGQGDVIPGWDIGVMSMKEKGKREMIVSPELAYGRKATGPIPPNATLHFTVELDMITPTMWTHVGFITKKLF